MRARRAARHDSFTSGAGISSPPVDPPHDIPDAPIPDSHEGHAFLHDFCMAIPYGMGMAVVGLVSLFFGAGSNGFLVAGLAAALLALTFLSLIQWRARRPSKVLTLAQAGLSFVLTWRFWSAVEGATGAKARLPNLLVAAVSAAMTAFLVYNVIAGGNPPKRTTEADDKALAQAAAES